MKPNFLSFLRTIFLFCHNTKPSERKPKLVVPEVQFKLEKTSSDEMRIDISSSGSSQEPLIEERKISESDKRQQQEDFSSSTTMIETIFCSESLQPKSSEKLFFKTLFDENWNFLGHFLQNTPMRPEKFHYFSRRWYLVSNHLKPHPASSFLIFSGSLNYQSVQIKQA